MSRPNNFYHNTRYYSSKQEKKVAKAIGGKQTANSGATKWVKGDVLADDWLLECKTHTEDRQQFTIKKEWIEKNKEEAFQMGKHHSALVIDFGDGTQHYLISERDFVEYLEYLREVNKE